MGVDIYCQGGTTRGLSRSYSGFARMRVAILTAAGPLDGIEPAEDWRYRITKEHHPRTYQGWWDDAPDEPLDVLFVHSDCDGYIFPQHAGPLAARLAGFIERVDPEEQSSVRALITVLEEADEEWRVVVFR